MFLIVCIDDRLGMAFHHRRLSQDRLLRVDLIHRLAGKSLWMNAYSFRQFEKENLSNITLHVEENIPFCVPAGEYCLLETVDPAAFKDTVEGIFLYRWNRVYPADTHFTFPLDSLTLQESFSFKGYSHDEITLEVYSR